jgi:hypothetical protein
MINNNHIQLIMNLVNIVNEWKKQKGKEYKDRENLFTIERKLIYYSNIYNKFENWIINNKFVLWIKEGFYSLFGTPYPEYIYCKEEDCYLSGFTKKYATDNKLLRFIRIVFSRETIGTELSVSANLECAMDVSKLSFLKKKNLLKNVNEFFDGEKSFYLRKILEYK